MKLSGFKQFIAFILLYLCTLLVTIDFNIKYINSEQLLYNLICSVLLFLCIYVILLFDMLFKRVIPNKIARLLLHTITTTGICILLLFINLKFKKIYTYDVIYWSNFWLLIFPIAYLLFNFINVGRSESDE